MSDGSPQAQADASGARRSAQAIDATLYLHPQTLSRLGSFELRAKMIVEGFSSGQHRSPYQGLSVEFAQHRPYVPGDDPRHLDWKVFGRTDRLQLKQHQQETNVDLVVLVDSSGSMTYGSRSFADASGLGSDQSPDGRTTWSKFDHATALSAALAYITLRQGDRVGVGVFANDLRALVKRSSSQGTWRQIVSALAMQPLAKQTGPTTALPRIMEQVLSKLHNRCIVALVSDLFMDVQHLRDALARLRFAGHDALVFQVLDQAEIDFNLSEAAPFEGLEGEGTLRIDPRALRDAYQQVFTRHQEDVQRTVRAMGFDYQRLSTHEWLGPPLAAFVARRNAFIKQGKRA